MPKTKIKTASLFNQAPLASPFTPVCGVTFPSAKRVGAVLNGLLSPPAREAFAAPSATIPDARVEGHGRSQVGRQPDTKRRRHVPRGSPLGARQRGHRPCSLSSYPSAVLLPDNPRTCPFPIDVACP